MFSLFPPFFLVFNIFYHYYHYHYYYFFCSPKNKERKRETLTSVIRKPGTETGRSSAACNYANLETTDKQVQSHYIHRLHRLRFLFLLSIFISLFVPSNKTTSRRESDQTLSPASPAGRLCLTKIIIVSWECPRRLVVYGGSGRRRKNTSLEESVSIFEDELVVTCSKEEKQTKKEEAAATDPSSERASTSRTYQGCCCCSLMMRRVAGSIGRQHTYRAALLYTSRSRTSARLETNARGPHTSATRI